MSTTQPTADFAPVAPSEIVISDFRLTRAQADEVRARMTVALTGFTIRGCSVLELQHPTRLVFAWPYTPGFQGGAPTRDAIVTVPENWLAVVEEVALNAYRSAIALLPRATDVPTPGNSHLPNSSYLVGK